MKKFLKALPLPACGVMLGLAALGNLLQAVFTNIFGSAGTGDTLRYICGALSSVIWIALPAQTEVLSQLCRLHIPLCHNGHRGDAEHGIL